MMAAVDRHIGAAVIDHRARLWRWAERQNLAARYAHGNARIDDLAVMWGMLCHAARVSAVVDRPPPRQGYPSASPGAWLTADEITAWQKMAAYIRGEVEEVDNAAPPRWSPAVWEIALRDAVLDVYFRHALRGIGDWWRLQRAVYALAAGMKPGRVTRATGINRHRLRHARQRAVADMLAAWQGGAAD